MCRRAGWRRFSSEPLEVGEPELDERPDGVLEPRFTCDRQRLLVALARLLRVDSLLEPVVARDQQSLDPLTDVVALHIPTVPSQISK